MKAFSAWLIVILILLSGSFTLLPVKSWAIVSLNMSGTMGYYRDILQRTHLPLFYSLSYTGLHEKGIESSLDLILNNDFVENQWSVFPSQAMVSVPLSKDYSSFRRSRVQLGRQFFTEGFDICLLDGVQMPVYWSKTGGVLVYGGSAHVMDLLDPQASPLAGTSVFDEFLGTKIKGGFAAHQEDLSDHVFYGSLLRQFANAPLAPQILVKGEVDQTTGNLAQSFSELQLNMNDDLSLSLSYSDRLPRRIAPDQNIFLYRIIAQAPQETEQVAVSWRADPSLDIQGLGRLMRYNAGIRTETGAQEETSFTWMFDAYQSISPVFDHITSYGGELWDTGVLYRVKMSDSAQYRLELASAHLDKIDNITGWAYNMRTGLSWLLASRLTAMAWIEVERNPLFDFDGRIIANVTFFN